MIDEGTRLWLIVFGGSVGAVILIELVHRFIKARPCWFFNHKMKHLSIELRIWNNSNGVCHRCDEWLQSGSYTASYKHYPHRKRVGDRTDYIPCYVTKWICAKEGCGEMGLYCVGDKNDGAWTIRNGEVVPDEKEWMKWS